jgi:hypothetical protein
MTDHPQDSAGYKTASISPGSLSIEMHDGSIFNVRDDTKLGDSPPAFTLSIQTDAGFQHIRITKRAAEYLMGWMSTKEMEHQPRRHKATP